MTRIRAITGRLAAILEIIVAIFFFVILTTTLLLVFLRYGLNTSIKGGYELTNYLFIYTTAIGAAVSIGRHDHIKIDYFVNMLRGTARRTVDVVAQLLVAFINGLILYLSVHWIQEVGSFRSPVLRLPNWAIQIAVPIGAACAILFCITNIAKDLIGDTDVGGASDADTTR